MHFRTDTCIRVTFAQALLPAPQICQSAQYCHSGLVTPISRSADVKTRARKPEGFSLFLSASSDRTVLRADTQSSCGSRCPSVPSKRGSFLTSEPLTQPRGECRAGAELNTRTRRWGDGHPSTGNPARHFSSFFHLGERMCF